MKKNKKEYLPVNQMSQNQRVDIVKDIFSTITYKYDFLNRLLSLRQDLSGRNAAIRKMRFFKSFKLLDIATGTIDLAIDAINTHPKIEAIGIDFVQEMVNYGNKKVKDQNLKDRVSLQWGDATNIDYKNNTFDVAAMAFGIRNIPNKTQALCEMERVVIPGGQIIIHTSIFKPRIFLPFLPNILV